GGVGTGPAWPYRRPTHTDRQRVPGIRSPPGLAQSEFEEGERTGSRSGMTVFLLDANALIALAWPAHEAHLRVQQWFARSAKEGWATCPLTQAAFVRIISNPAFSPDAVTPREALN